MEDAAAGQRKEHLDALAIALLLSCCAFWGFQQVLVKATLGELAPIFMAGVRFAGAAAVLWLWCLWRGVPLWRRDGPHQIHGQGQARSAGAQQADLAAGLAPVVGRKKRLKGQAAGDRILGAAPQPAVSFREATDLA